MPAVAKKAVKSGKKPWEVEGGWATHYGRRFAPQRDVTGKPVNFAPKWRIESACFMQCMGWDENKRPPPPQSPGEFKIIPGREFIRENGDIVKLPDEKIHTGALHHFIEFANCFFSDPHGIFYFQWQAWSTQMLEDKIMNRRYAMAGSASSGKTEFLVVWGLLNYLCLPFKTKVLVGSTTKQAAKGKVWGSFTEAWQQVQRIVGEKAMPGKLLKSQDKIVFEEGEITSTKAGIELIAGAQSEEAESAERVQGYKRDRVFVCADEFATMSPGLYKTIKGNLFANPMLDFTAAFNPDSFYDVAGTFSQPIDPRGWESVNVNTDCWKSVEGFVRHFDGEKSPNANFITGQEKYRGLLTYDKIQQRISDAGGRDTKEFFMMVKGWWCPSGILDTIYTELEVINNLGDHDVSSQFEPGAIPVAGLDPAFKHGGDLAVATFGLIGWITEPISKMRRKVAQIKEIVVLYENVNNNTTRDIQVVNQFIEECKKRKVDPRHVAVDVSGNGSSFASLIALGWSNDFLRVEFGERATETPVSRENPKKSCDEYANRVTELWMSGKPLLRSGQFKFGNKPDLIKEACLRITRKHPTKRMVEPKDEFKKRLQGKSCDRSDSAFLMLDVCRQRLGLVSTEKPGKFHRETQKLNPLHSFLTGKKPKQPLFDYGQSLKPTSSGPSWNGNKSLW